MTDSYAATPEDQIGNLCRDAYVLATVAKQGRLNVKAATGLVSRLRSHVDRMIGDADREMLRTAADGFERLGDRIKSAEVRPRSRVKAAPQPAPGPDIAAMNRAADAEMINRGGHFDRDQFEDVQRRRSKTQNEQLHERQRKAEEQRRQQVERQVADETPWWRR